MSASPTHQQWYKPRVFWLKQYSLDPRAPGRKWFLLGLLLPEDQDLPQPREASGQASAMRIQYLLFPFFLLLVQSAAAAGGEKKCSRQKGFCFLLSCPFGYKFVGLCSTVRHCCKRIWG
ncbi:gallinacin-1 alpha-like [Haliaeetus albicilla]|uniref:gallinacin-1 alpha-like n=1 Tax=Haliaeetus albicilla TaxID=8969 RepID=UPI0037E79368